jgi:hypothetical protein
MTLPEVTLELEKDSGTRSPLRGLAFYLASFHIQGGVVQIDADLNSCARQIHNLLEGYKDSGIVNPDPGV